MSMECQIAAFEGGQLRVLETGESGREVALALPLNRLLVKMVRVPVGEDPVAFCEPFLKAQSPFPDEPLTVSCETVREDEAGKIVIAAALPEGAADDIGEALDAAKLTVVRIDALVLGQLRGVWASLGDAVGRRCVLFKSPDCLSILILDGDQPSALRAITNTEDLRREMMLSLLEAEDFGGARKLDEIVVVSSDPVDTDVPSSQVSQDSLAPQVDAGSGDESDSRLSLFAPVRSLTVGADAALMGVAERVRDGASTLNALPESWREMLEESRFKRKLTKYVAIAGGLWLLTIAVMFGVPFGYDFATSRQKTLSKRHERQYREVKLMKEKVGVIAKYSDHARGALEIMKAVSDRLPEGITLSKFDYKRESGVTVAGETAVKDETYAFKDNMDGLVAVDADGEETRIFPKVELRGPSTSRGGFRFSLECQYGTEGE